MPVDYGALGQAAGGVAQQYLQPSQGLNEQQRNRQANIATENEYATQIARDRSFDPTRAFREMQRGLNMAAALSGGTKGTLGGYGQAPGADYSGRAGSAEGNFEGAGDIIRALNSLETYSMRKDEQGNTVFDPAAFNPLNLAFASGAAREGGYIQDGEKRQFGREGLEDGGDERYKGAASGALSGVSTGASVGGAVGGPVGAGIGAGVGAAGGAIVGYVRGRGITREARENRQQNIAALNQLSADVAAKKLMDPTSGLFNMLRGENIAGALEGGSRIPGEGYGAAPGGYQDRALTSQEESIVNAMRNQETFGMRRGKNGELIWDPLAFNTPDLAFMEGRAREGGYSRAGDTEPRYFGRNSSGGSSRGGGRQRSREPEEEQERQ